MTMSRQVQWWGPGVFTAVFTWRMFDLLFPRQDANLLHLVLFSSLHTCTVALSDGPICRICHEGGSSEGLLSPCYCTGTLGTVHKSCLEKWLSSSNTSYCELCHSEFSIERRPRPLTEVTQVCPWLRLRHSSCFARLRRARVTSWCSDARTFEWAERSRLPSRGTKGVVQSVPEGSVEEFGLFGFLNGSGITVEAVSHLLCLSAPVICPLRSCALRLLTVCL